MLPVGKDILALTKFLISLVDENVRSSLGGVGHLSTLRDIKNIFLFKINF